MFMLHFRVLQLKAMFASADFPVVIVEDGTAISLLNDIKNHSFNKNQILLAATLNTDNLYELCDVKSPHNCSPNDKSYSSPLPILSDHGRLPSLFKAAQDTKSSVLKVPPKWSAVKPPFSISHGSNGSADSIFSLDEEVLLENLPTKPTDRTDIPNSLKPTSSVLYPHLFAEAAYYQT